MTSDGKDADNPDDKGSFTVTDRRIFADDKGAARVEEVPPSAASGGAREAARPVSEAAPVMDFHTFVLSLGSSALLHLGELERPGAVGPEKDLPMAKHTIDILSMLQDKTRGNLTPEEQKLIESLVYDLKLRYVEALGRR